VARPKLDVVIVNWNTGPYLRACLQSLAAATRTEFDFGTVVVVDNASSDGSLEGLDELSLPLRILRNAENRGFAAACNQGAREGDGDFVLFLNPDTRPSPEALDRSIAFMSDPENATVGICGGRVVGDSGNEERSCARFPTLWMFVAKMLGLAHAFPRWIPRQRINADELGGSAIVDQVIGAYFLIRRSVFELLDGFDERFFVYLEDVDLAYRSKQSGYSSYFLADVPVYHAGNVSSEQVRGKRLFYLLRGQTEYAHKHWPSWQPRVLALLILTVELPVRWSVAATRGSRQERKDVSQAARRYLAYVTVGRSDAVRPE
jgi:GT2 family glycosyltransferase